MTLTAILRNPLKNQEVPNDELNSSKNDYFQPLAEPEKIPEIEVFRKEYPREDTIFPHFFQ